MSARCHGCGSCRSCVPEPPAFPYKPVRVHNHPPYRPVCNERVVDGQLRGACLNDDGSDR